MVIKSDLSVNCRLNYVISNIVFDNDFVSTVQSLCITVSTEFFPPIFFRPVFGRWFFSSACVQVFFAMFVISSYDFFPLQKVKLKSKMKKYRMLYISLVRWTLNNSDENLHTQKMWIEKEWERRDDMLTIRQIQNLF